MTVGPSPFSASRCNAAMNRAPVHGLHIHAYVAEEQREVAVAMKRQIC